MQTGNHTELRRGIPGRWFVIPFGVLLAFLLWLVFSMALRFQTIMSQLEATRSAWPSVSTLFSDRYTSVHDAMRKAEVDRPLGEWENRFVELHKEFSSSTQFDQQSRVVGGIEDVLGEHRGEFANVLPLDMGLPAIVKIRDLEQKRRSLQSDFVGKCTVRGLRLKLPPIFLSKD